MQAYRIFKKEYRENALDIKLREIQALEVNSASIAAFNVITQAIQAQLNTLNPSNPMYKVLEDNLKDLKLSGESVIQIQKKDFARLEQEARDEVRRQKIRDRLTPLYQELSTFENEMETIVQKALSDLQALHSSPSIVIDSISEAKKGFFNASEEYKARFFEVYPSLQHSVLKFQALRQKVYGEMLLDLQAVDTQIAEVYSVAEFKKMNKYLGQFNSELREIQSDFGKKLDTRGATYHGPSPYQKALSLLPTEKQAEINRAEEELEQAYDANSVLKQQVVKKKDAEDEKLNDRYEHLKIKRPNGTEVLLREVISDPRVVERFKASANEKGIVLQTNEEGYLKKITHQYILGEGVGIGFHSYSGSFFQQMPGLDLSVISAIDPNGLYHLNGGKNADLRICNAENTSLGSVKLDVLNRYQHDVGVTILQSIPELQGIFSE